MVNVVQSFPNKFLVDVVFVLENTFLIVTKLNLKNKSAPLKVWYSTELVKWFGSSMAKF